LVRVFLLGSNPHAFGLVENKPDWLVRTISGIQYFVDHPNPYPFWLFRFIEKENRFQHKISPFALEGTCIYIVNRFLAKQLVQRGVLYFNASQIK